MELLPNIVIRVGAGLRGIFRASSDGRSRDKIERLPCNNPCLMPEHIRRIGLYTPFIYSLTFVWE